MTSKESFDALASIENEKNPYEMTPELYKSLTPDEREDRKKAYHKWKVNRDKRRSEAIDALVPEVGLPCTVVYYSDKRAATVSRIITPRKIAVKFNETICKNWYASDYEILPEIDESMGEDIFTKRRNGLWCMEGQNTKDGVLLMLHYQRHYIDPSF